MANVRSLSPELLLPLVGNGPAEGRVYLTTVDEFFADCFFVQRSIIRAAIPVVFSLIVPPTEKSFQLMWLLYLRCFFW